MKKHQNLLGLVTQSKLDFLNLLLKSFKPHEKTKQKIRSLCYTYRRTIPKTYFLNIFKIWSIYCFLTAISHRGLRNCFFFEVASTFSMFFLDFYFPFLFGLLFPFSIWTFILFRFVLNSFYFQVFFMWFKFSKMCEPQSIWRTVLRLSLL